jgi:hypothetical protein
MLFHGNEKQTSKWYSLYRSPDNYMIAMCYNDKKLVNLISTIHDHSGVIKVIILYHSFGRQRFQKMEMDMCKGSFHYLWMITIST